MRPETFTEYRDWDEIETDEMPDSDGGYIWKGVDALGREFQLRSYAKTAAEAAKEINAVGIRVFKLRPTTVARRRRHLPKHQELASLARNFGEQIEAGNTPQEILKMLAEAEENETLANGLKGTLVALQNGRELHNSFDLQRDHKNRPVFPRELVTAVEIGIGIGATLNHETGKKESGLLTTLRRFAEGQEKADKIRAAIRSAMMYPATVMIVAVIAIAIVTIWVMPVMEQMFKALLQGKKDASLPFLTQMMISLSHFVWSFWGAVTIIAITGGAFLFYRWWKSPAGQDFKGRQIIFMPGVGNFYRMLYSSQLLRYLSMLSAGGDDIKVQFKLAAESTENPVYREMLENLHYQARVQGQSLTTLYKPYLHLFGREFLGSLMTADETGDPSAPFYRYAQVLEMRVNRQLETVLTLFKTLVIFPIGIIVAIIVAAIISPFFELAGRLSQ